MIAESQKAVDEAEEFLLGLFDRARISGKGVLDDSPGCSENLVNEINIVSPDVIASFFRLRHRRSSFYTTGKSC